MSRITRRQKANRQRRDGQRAEAIYRYHLWRLRDCNAQRALWRKEREAENAASPAPVSAGAVMRDQPGAGGRDHRGVAAGVVAVLVGVENLGDLPALGLGGRETFLMIQGIDGKRFAGVGAGNQIVEIAIRVTGPDTLDDHLVLPGS